MYKETYRELSHGTDEESAEKIRAEGFEIRGRSDSWCGKGAYFYDIKKKAWWAAKRKCEEIKKESGRKIKPVVILADIVDIEDKYIFDLRAHKDLCDFEKEIKEILGNCSFEMHGVDDEIERIIKLRAMLISYYADRKKKKLIIGNFRQRPQPMYEHAIEFSNSLDMIFGIETIYCVKDNSILENIR